MPPSIEFCIVWTVRGVRTPGLRRALRAQLDPPPAAGRAADLARAIVSLGGDTVLGIVFFGSRKTRAAPDRFSAYDLLVVVDRYSRFYRRLERAGALHRPAWLLAVLNAVLAPNAISLFGGETTAPAKCLVLSLAGFSRETSARRRDHFTVARLYQATEILWAADEATRALLFEGIASAHEATYEWVRPWLTREFDVDGYTRAILRVSLGTEVRPEPPRRSQDLWAAQRSYLRAVYAALLADLAATGDLSPAGGGGYRLARPVSRAERWRMRAYLGRARVRATLRWPKHVLTFSGWLEYLRRKAERHSGQPIDLTARERRLPLVFLWPRIVRHLRRKDLPPASPP